jgi:hypothetical protein
VVMGGCAGGTGWLGESCIGDVWGGLEVGVPWGLFIGLSRWEQKESRYPGEG